MDRRKFIKVTTIASATTIPLLGFLSCQLDGAMDSEATSEFNKSLEFQLIDNNLMAFNFYFINVKRERKWLKANDEAANAYMIVRLPQMHITEKGFWNDPNNRVPKFPDAKLSGFSYLAFQLWPTRTYVDSKGKLQTSTPEKQMEFTLENLLNWNDSISFELITLVEWFDLKKVSLKELQFVEKKDVINKKTWNEKKGQATETCYQSNHPSSEGFNKYRSIITLLLDGNLKPGEKPSCFVPITFFEFPQSLLLVPISSDAKGILTPAEKKFYSNKFYNQQKTAAGYRKYEVWNNTLWYQKEVAPVAGGKKEFKIETPSFRAIGMIEDNSSGTIGDPCSVGHTTTDSYYLPSVLDKAELVYLTQYARTQIKEDRNFTQPDFDIRELNGLFYTSLGVITHLKYYNLDKMPPDTDLIEYEHIIAEGRDVFIKVARLGYNSKTGQRYKHVIEGKRKIESLDAKDPELQNAASYIEFKQYCECIDISIDYTDYKSSWARKTTLETKDETILNSLPILLPSLSKVIVSLLPGSAWDLKGSVLSILHGTAVYTQYDNKDPQVSITLGPKPNQATIINASPNLAHKRRLPVTTLTVNEKNRIPIDCLQDAVQPKDICTLETLLWFWPILDNSSPGNPNGCDVPLGNYLPCVYTAIDHETQQINAATPFMFIRKALLEGNSSPDRVAEMLANYNSTACQNYIDRRKTYLNGQKLAFTPSLKEEKAAPGITKEEAQLLADNNLNGSKSKVNILETDFIDNYFTIRNFDTAPSQLISQIKHVIYPQVLRARVYVDHIKDLTQQKIPSIIEYHSDYIQHNLDEYSRPADVLLGNGAKLILKNTEAYLHNLEEPANRTYSTITKALQESKDKLGNLVVPDIVPDSISLEKLGITAPPAMKQAIQSGQAVLGQMQNGFQQIQNFNPIALLRGKLSNICGLDLTPILDELLPALPKDNQTPLFEITKVINQITYELNHSALFQKLNEQIKTVKDKINTLENGYTTIATTINSKEQQLAANLKVLSNAIPSTDDLNNLIKNAFEKYRSQAIELAVDHVPFNQVKDKINSYKADAQAFIDRETVLLYAEIAAAKTKAQDILDNIATELQLKAVTEIYNDPDPVYVALTNKINEVFVNKDTNNVFANFTGFYANYFSDPAFPDNLKSGRLTLLMGTTDESVITVGGKSIYINPGTLAFEEQNTPATNIPFTQLNSLKDTGLVQLQRKMADFKLLIVKNINGNDFQKSVVSAIQAPAFLDPYTNKLNDLLTKADNFRYSYTNASGAVEFDVVSYSARIQKWSKDFDEKFQRAIDKGMTPAAQDSLRKVKDLINRLNPYADVLKKLDPYLYYTEQQRLNKDITDIKSRFQQTLYTLYTSVDTAVKTSIEKYNGVANDYCAKTLSFRNAVKRQTVSPPIPPAEYNDILKAYNNAMLDFRNIKQSIIEDLKNEANKIVLDYISQLANSNAVKTAFIAIYGDQTPANPGLVAEINKAKKDYQDKLNSYLDYVKAEGSKAEESIYDAIGQFIADHPDEVELVSEARNLYRLLTSIKQQDLTYNWNTTGFRDADLGVVAFKKFSNPDTTLSVNVKATTYFTPGKFPPAIDRVTVYSDNHFSNFGISFFSCITLGFKEISFTAGSGQSTHFDVKIKDIKFDGALSFVQAFEKWLQTMGKGLILELEADHVGLGYSLAIPAITSPGFNVFNLSLNFDLRLYFDQRPMRFGFSLARPESKFGIAVGIYAGFGFFGIVADPKKGVVEVDIALEAGVWAGIAIGPITGEAKLAFGFRYTKNESGVRLEGYIVAEGRLSVWILEIAARIYLGVVSENSYVEGICTVTYSVKLGFISKSFSGSFHQKIAGSKSNNTGTASKSIADFHHDLAMKLPGGGTPLKKEDLQMQIDEVLDHHRKNGEQAMETASVSEEAWKKFITIF